MLFTSQHLHRDPVLAAAGLLLLDPYLHSQPEVGDHPIHTHSSYEQRSMLFQHLVIVYLLASEITMRL